MARISKKIGHNLHSLQSDIKLKMTCSFIVKNEAF